MEERHKKIVKTVADCMNRDVYTQPPETRIGDLVHYMAQHSVDCVVVVEDGKPAGIVTERDPASIIIFEDQWRELSVREVMSHPVTTIPADLEIEEAMNWVRRNRHYRRYPVVDEKGRLVGIVTQMMIVEMEQGILRDSVDDLERQIEMLREQVENLTVRDELTGLMNRGYFNRSLAEEWSRSTRYGQPLSLLMVDLDDFRALNAAHGKSACDLILAEAASRLSLMLRSSDTAARYGGDEFVVILPMTEEKEAKGVAEKVCAAVSQHEFSLPGGEPISLRVSVGVAGRSARDNSLGSEEELLRAADMALSEARREGRDCVRVHKSKTADKR